MQSYDPNNVKVIWNGVELEGWDDEPSVVSLKPYFFITDLPNWPKDHPDYKEDRDNYIQLVWDEGADRLRATFIKGGETHKLLLSLDPYDINNKPKCK